MVFLLGIHVKACFCLSHSQALISWRKEDRNIFSRLFHVHLLCPLFQRSSLHAPFVLWEFGSLAGGARDLRNIGRYTYSSKLQVILYCFYLRLFWQCGFLQ